MTEQTVLDEKLSPNQGMLATLDQSGDTKLIWDRTREPEVENARRTFDDLKAKGYLAYKVEGEKGSKGEVLHKFDAEAERIIMAPRPVGG